jgi:hypothetical protein
MMKSCNILRTEVERWKRYVAQALQFGAIEGHRRLSCVLRTRMLKHANEFELHMTNRLGDQLAGFYSVYRFNTSGRKPSENASTQRYSRDMT